jgi:hypothetical protein
MVRDGIERCLLETASNIRRISTGITCPIVLIGFTRSQVMHMKHKHTEVRFGVFVQSAVTMGNGYAPIQPPHTDCLSFSTKKLYTMMMMALPLEVDPLTGVLEVLIIDEHHIIIGSRLTLVPERHRPVQGHLYTIGVAVYLLKTHHLLVLMLNYFFMTR